MRHVVPICLLLLLPDTARADAGYHVYACEGPRLVSVSGHDLTPGELAARYPGLGPAPATALAVVIEGGSPAWTELPRKALRARCLARDDAARAPRRGEWDLAGPVFETGGCGLPDVTAPLHGFPRALEFGDAFHPDAVLGRSPAAWQVLRDPDSFIWYAFAAPPGEVPGLEGLSFEFHPAGPDLIVIEGALKTAGGCGDEFSLSLIRLGE